MGLWEDLRSCTATLGSTTFLKTFGLHHLPGSLPHHSLSKCETPSSRATKKDRFLFCQQTQWKVVESVVRFWWILCRRPWIRPRSHYTKKGYKHRHLFNGEPQKQRVSKGPTAASLVACYEAVFVAPYSNAIWCDITAMSQAPWMLYGRVRNSSEKGKRVYFTPHYELCYTTELGTLMRTVRRSNFVQ